MVVKSDALLEVNQQIMKAERHLDNLYAKRREVINQNNLNKGTANECVRTSRSGRGIGLT